jgi:hypothetical protein
MTFLTVEQSIKSLEGATIVTATAKLNKEKTEFNCLTLLLADGRRIDLWSYVSDFGSCVHAAESSMDIEISS